MWRFLALTIMATVVPVLAVAAACGGDEGPAGPAATPTTPPTPTAPATTPPAVPDTPTPTATATPRPPGTARLMDLSSYRYTMRWEIAGVDSVVAERLGRLADDPDALPDPFVVVVRGSFVAPDSQEASYTISGVDGEFTVVVIDNDQWLKLPGGAIIGPTTFEGSLDDVNEAVSFWDQRVAEADVPITCAGAGTELVNGVAARHCQITTATIQQLARLLDVDIDEEGQITTLSFDLWVHDSEGYPVRVRMALQGVDEEEKAFSVQGALDITDANSPAIQVQPPS
ncbi:MAG: hypothetical protein ACE5IZ_08095 [Dehalococcoidia bacterium]